MKKIIVFLFLLIAGVFAFADPMNSFYGIPYGSSYKVASEILKTKGWQCIDSQRLNDDSTLMCLFNTLDADYAGTYPYGLMTMFFKDQMFMAVLMYNVEADSTDYQHITKVRDAIIEKYQLKFSNDSLAYQDTDGNLYSYEENGYDNKEVLFLFYDKELYDSQVSFIKDIERQEKERLLSNEDL